MKSMRDTEAQTSIDFLVGIVVFAGIILFAFQFVSSTAAPFVSPQTADQKATEAHTVGDRLYYDKLSVEGSDSLNLSYFANSTDTGVKNETKLASELGLVPGADSVSDVRNASSRRELTVSVTKPGGDPVRLNGEDVTIGNESIAPTARATRVGYTETNDTVVIDVGVR